MPKSKAKIKISQNVSAAKSLVLEKSGEIKKCALRERLKNYYVQIMVVLKKNLSTVWSWGILIVWIIFTVFSFCILSYGSEKFKVIEVIPYQISMPEKLSVKTQCEFVHPVTGVCLQVKGEELTYPVEDLEKAKVYAVMVENHTAARPQSGLGEADVVYEALVEGGFTRFMAIFDSLQTVKAIGPVRSARDYYLWWAQEYNNPVYAHVGGSPKALDLIAKQGIVDCDEFYHGDIFERVTWRYAPHNTYVSVADLGLCRPTKPEAGLWTEIDPWHYSNEEISGDVKVDNIEISYSQNANYEVEWQYNEEEGVYYRFNAGQPHLDKNSNQQITAKNVIVMEALSRVIDDIGRLEMNNIGSGPVLIYNQGTKQKGEWQKESYSGRTRFVDKAGNDLLLAPGNTWIQVVPSYFNAVTEK
ncbi:MAG TPA: DUF3048 domain-containing protein [bacterium]|nr:DUF3048 domain-containing protein [bacterium]